MLHLSLNVYADTPENLLRIAEQTFEMIRNGRADADDVEPHGGYHLHFSGTPEDLTESNRMLVGELVAVRQSVPDGRNQPVPVGTLGMVIGDDGEAERRQLSVLFSTGQEVALTDASQWITPAVFPAFIDVHREEFFALEALVAQRPVP
jgi:hypothetical protein